MKTLILMTLTLFTFELFACPRVAKICPDGSAANVNAVTCEHTCKGEAPSSCTRVASRFVSKLNNCWNQGYSGCIRHYTSKRQMSDRDFHGCKRSIFIACERACYGRFGHGDQACLRGCHIIGKYL